MATTIRKIIPSEEEFDDIDAAANVLKDRLCAFPTGSKAWFMKGNAPTCATVIRHDLTLKGSSITLSTSLMYPGNDCPEYICKTADVLKDFLFSGLLD